MDTSAARLRRTFREEHRGTRYGDHWEVFMLIALVTIAVAVFGYYLLPLFAELLADGIESAM